MSQGSDFAFVPVKRRQPNLFESIFVNKNNQGFREENLTKLEEDLSVSLIAKNAKTQNQSCLLLHLWSKPFKDQREQRLSYSAGPNMEQKNTFQVLQYMTRTWKKHCTGLPSPKIFEFVTQKSKDAGPIVENNFRLLTPELLGFTAGENWKNKKATLVVKLSQKSLLMLQKQTFRTEGKVTNEDKAFVFRLTLPTDKSLQSILSNKRYPKAWIRNIYDESKDDLQSSKDFIEKIYEELKISGYINRFIDEASDNVEVALSLESIVNNRKYLLNETELKIFFNLKEYFGTEEYDDKESFFKLIFEKTYLGINAYLVPLETENRRFNISNNFKINLKIPINVFHFIVYANEADNNNNYVYVQQIKDDLPYVELSELTWSNKGNIFNNSKEYNATREIILKPIFPKQAEELEMETFKIKDEDGEKVHETYKKIIEKGINECVNSKNVYPLERKINLKYGCLIPHTMSKNIFKKTSQLLQEHISRILEAKQTLSSDAFLNQSLWIQETKVQLIKSLIPKRQISLIKRLPGFRLWEDVMQDNQILYEWNIVMYKDQLYRLNRGSNNYIWAQMKTDYVIDDNNSNDYFQGEILRDVNNNRLWEVYYDNFNNRIDEQDTFITDNPNLTDREVEKKFRPNGFGIKNFDRFYRTNKDAKENKERVYHIDSSETPLKNVFLKLQGNDKDNANKYVTDEGTDWFKLIISKKPELNSDVLISAYEDQNENFINCFDDPEFVEEVKKLWDLDSYMPSKYLLEHFEYLKGFLKPEIGKQYDFEPEFSLDPKKQVFITYTNYGKDDDDDARQELPKDPNKELFTITIISNFDEDDEEKQVIKAPWWEAWYVEWDYKRNLFDYTDLELEYLDRNYKKIFIDFVNNFSMHYNAPPLNFIRTVLK